MVNKHVAAINERNIKAYLLRDAVAHWKPVKACAHIDAVIAKMFVDIELLEDIKTELLKGVV